MQHETRHLSKDNISKIENAVKDILEALGADLKNQDIAETPDRVARMYDEVFEGMRYSNKEIAQMFDRCFETAKATDMVCLTDIDTFSYCEHHLALMYNMKVHVAYVPRRKIIGLSKIPRIVDMVCKRLQLQEKIGNDIADILEMILGTKDIMVVIEGEHSCVTTRGIRKPGTVTTTMCVRGLFKKNENLKNEFLLQIK
ncbi:MAG: GTP cyclohydrolase I FolE [Treponema sp.]|uniref:GTP cyclohydrolase I FolE n=1 Tax=Treponema sp. TaxID=166 RepID=UPI001B6B38BD|nr:GTP cyclohydrolase I FolE [Treponema sp.]MBP5403223.1 GTP cyclohydrolase I FolE [Treponema sp.]MBR5932755.1 GTP cyclohydrolase I FolE [Treponema sp.]